MDLKAELSKTNRGMLLWDEAHDDLLKTKPEKVKKGAFDHPYQLLKHTDEFKKVLITEDQEPQVVVLADTDVLSVFKWDPARTPTFYLAGGYKKICFDPMDNQSLKVGILTAGGNAPGLDTIVDSLVKHQFSLWSLNKNHGDAPYELDENGYPRNLKIYGIRGGYTGLVELKPGDPESEKQWLLDLHPRITDSWPLRGCTSLHTLRGKMENNPAEFDNFIETLTAKVKALGLNILYTLGGNGTMKVAGVLAEKLGDQCLVIAGPKTMDNDINFTDFTFGFRTTSDNAIKFLSDFHRETETTERLGIVELFGAASGFVALHAAYACGEVDYVLIPEMVGDTVESALTEFNKMLDSLTKRIRKRRHALLVIAETATIKICSALQNETQPQAKLMEFSQGITDFKEKAFEVVVAKIKEKKLGVGILVSQPKHLIRATPPNGFDIDLCKYTGKLMVDTALGGFTGCSVHLWQGNYVLVPLVTAIEDVKNVDIDSYYFKSTQEKYLLYE
ncbi:MAG TPA: 6-phosphofructokinase [Bacillota bacterium]|nr:6-phosphofructokinase [Bacillota bacterium]